MHVLLGPCLSRCPRRDLGIVAWHRPRVLRLTYSNRSEALAETLVARLRERDVSPLTPTHLVVPNRNLERFLELTLAEHLGIAANLRFHRLERFVIDTLARARPTERVLDRRTFESRVLGALLHLPRDPALDPVRRYLEGAGEDPDAIDVRRVQLALRIGRLFESYAFSRPELLGAWAARRSGLPPDASAELRATETWQRALWWRALTGAKDRFGARLRPLPGIVRDFVRDPQIPKVPDQVHVFGLSYVARVFQWALSAIGRATDLHVYVLNPCLEFWEDLPSESELRSQRARFPERFPIADLDDLEAIPRLETGTDPPLLSYWGRPGREHVHLLNELTGANFDARFVLPEARSVLERLQRDILERQPERTEPERDPDGSLVAFAAPGVRREVEVVVEEIWRLVREDPELRFNEIAVFVHPGDRDLYLPHLASVMGEAHALPHHVIDLPLAAESRVVEAALMLVELPFGRFRRPEVLALLTHPALRVPGVRAADDDDRQPWAMLVERLGIFHGLDRADHAGTYIERDLVNWDQGAWRLVLGQLMTGEPSGDERAFAIDSERYFPEEADADARAAALAAIVSSLVADVRYARDAQLTLREWATFFAGMFRGYLGSTSTGAAGDRQEAELRRCLGATSGLADRDVTTRAQDGPVKVRYRVAAELMRETLAGLGGSRGEYLADGVVVSALAPMRAIPFRHIFCLGLGEGRFPASERRDPLDLRAARRRVGDVTPSERDEYVFLEALLCARDRFHVSWVARDPITGDPIEPSPVVKQLLEVLERGYVRESVVQHVPLQRHDGATDERPHLAIPEVAGEREAANLGEALSEHLGRPPKEPELRALAKKDPAFRGALGLAELPSRAEPIESGARVSIANLRRFLEAPMQAWARAVLRIDEEPSAMASGLEDEPLDATSLEVATALRDSFVRGLRDRMPPREAYAEKVERLQAHGQWPLGLLAERAREDHETVLRGWQRAFSHAVGDATLERIRFGGGAEHGEAEEVRDALELPVRLGDEAIHVRLVGRTEALFDARSASLVLVKKKAPVGAELERERLRYALRGFVDHLVLSASGARPAAPHRALVLYGGETAQDASTRFGPVSPEASRQLLADLVEALLGETHDYFLPCEAVFRDPRAWPTLTARSLARVIEGVRRRGGGQSQWGPVPDATRYPAPDPETALGMVERRFGAFFRLAGLGDRSGRARVGSSSGEP